MNRVLVLTVFFLINMWCTAVSAHGSPLDEVKGIVDNHYIGEIPTNLNDMVSIESIMEQLDSYSMYFTKEEFDVYTGSINNTSIGIGVNIEEHVQGIQVVRTYEGGAAEKTGIIAGDIITKVNGISTERMSVQQASELIKGKEGTTVELEILTTSNQRQVYKVVRQKFQVPVVTEKLLYGNIGYISISTFSEDGALLVQEAKEKLLKQGATSFILDLTNNGGGYVHTAEELIGLFPNSPYAYTLRTRAHSGVVKSVKSDSLFPKNTKVLVNGYSASASEMTAAALLDQQSAVLYGQKTFGKGSMQSTFRLSDGSYVKLSIAHFAGPKGTIVNNTGILPHIVTEVGKELEQAHLDAILANKTYKKMASLTNVPISKEFTVTFSDDVKAKSNIELVKLGGTNSVPVAIKQKSSTQLVVTPQASLERGAVYLLLIHPKIQSTKGKWMKKGAYVEVTVQP